MQIGAVFPQAEMVADPGAIREYVQAAEDMGYSHLIIADHVLGVHPDFYPQVAQTPYSHKTLVHEPFTLMGFIAAASSSLGLATGVLILPQRQTALVAKQAAEVDVLSGGRLRLGIGVGWNEPEHEALGQDFHSRGRRSEEQIALLRALWTQETVTFQGRWHTVSHAGINPLPVQRPIPLWIGAGRSPNPVPPDLVVRRIGRLADGWLASFSPQDAGVEAVSRMRTYAAEAGRDPASVGIEGRIGMAGTEPAQWAEDVQGWRDLGATHVSADARRGGLASTQEHIDALRRFKEAVG